MANRITYNAEDVFVGSPNVETDDSFTFIPNYKILKRLSRVQSVGYEINTPNKDLSIIGKKSSAYTHDTTPTEINIEINYMMHGIENEKRLGFYVEEQGIQRRNFLHNIVHSSRDYDRRNLYLVTNPTADNVRDSNESFYNDISLKRDIRDLPTMTDPKSPDYEVLAFQNCYVTNYDFDISIGEIASSTVSMAADNAMFFASGSGIGIPVLDTKDGKVTHSEEKFVIPKRFEESDKRDLLQALIFRNGDISVDITQNDIIFTPSYISNFETDIDGWKIWYYHANIAALSRQDNHGDPVEYDVLKFTQDVDDNVHYIYRPGEFKIGGTYRIKGKFWIPSTNTHLSKVWVFCQDEAAWAAVFNKSAGPDSGFIFKAEGSGGEYVHDQWVEFDVEFKANATDLLILGSTSYGGINDFTYDDPQAPKDVFYMTDMVIEKYQDRINFHNDKITSVGISLDIKRSAISYLGHKNYYDKPPNFPINTSVQLAYLADVGASGDYLDNLKEKSNYDISLYFRKGDNLIIQQDIIGATLMQHSSESSIGSNKVNNLTFMSNMDFDNNKNGLFVSGERDFSEVSVVHDTHGTITNNGQPISLSQVIQY